MMSGNAILVKNGIIEPFSTNNTVCFTGPIHEHCERLAGFILVDAYCHDEGHTSLFEYQKKISPSLLHHSLNATGSLTTHDFLDKAAKDRGFHRRTPQKTYSRSHSMEVHGAGHPGEFLTRNTKPARLKAAFRISVANFSSKLRASIARFRLRLALLGIGGSLFAVPGLAAPAITTRESFLDAGLVATVYGLEWRLGSPVVCGSVVAFNRPWEGAFAGAISMVHDGVGYRMYYRGADADSAGNYDVSSEVVCYAESADGIYWSKPALKLHFSEKWPENNIVMIGDKRRAASNLAVIYDGRPGVPAAERYKALGGITQQNGAGGYTGGLFRYVSGDGLLWRLYADAALFGDLPLGAHSFIFDKASGKYVVYLRLKPEEIKGDQPRPLMRATSGDFLNWTEATPVTVPDTGEYLYTFPIIQDARLPQLQLAMPLRLQSDRHVMSETELGAIGASPLIWKSGVSDTVLLYSFTGDEFLQPFAESFIRPGPNRENWVSRSNGVATGLLKTGPIENSLYVHRAYTTRLGRVDRLALRPDGWAGWHAGYEAGYAITRPLRLPGGRMTVNLSTSAKGSLKVVILDEQQRELAGFGEDDAGEVIGDGIDLPVTWAGDCSLSSLAGTTVRLKFILRDADIYSFAFHADVMPEYIVEERADRL